MSPIESERRPSSRWTLAAYASYALGVRRTLPLFLVAPALEQLANRRWELEPASVSVSSRAWFLPGQLERIASAVYTDDPVRDMQGGVRLRHSPARAFLLKDVLLANDSLFKGKWRFDLCARKHLSRVQKFLPPIHVTTELDRASIYGTHDGNEFFALWLMDDCPAYGLAANEGTPLSCRSTYSRYPSQATYESLLGMQPLRTATAFLKEAVIIDDGWNHGSSKHARFAALRSRLLAQFPGKPHPGTFILRRNSGKARSMANELEVAEYLRDRRGFTIVDVTRHTAPEILAACAGARVLAGIEGSHLANGLVVLEPGAALLVLQPPDRFSGVLKLTADMEDIAYAFVVGTPAEGGFSVEPEEIERTLDLLPSLAR